MLYNTVENDWGETVFVPTTLGNVLLAVIILSLLAVAVFLARKHCAAHSKQLAAKQLAFCSMAIALGCVLSNIKFFDFPTGGSITLLSMLVACLPGYWFGPGAGLLTGIAAGLLQLAIDPYVLYPMQLLLDYPLAFGALGLSGIFCNSRHGLVKGYCLGVLGRYICSTLSGWLFFGSYAWKGWNPLAYSVVYNAIYIFAEAALTLLILQLPPVKKMMAAVKKMATEN